MWPIRALGFALCFLEVPVSGGGMLGSSRAPRALHLPGIPDTCALRIVPASSAFHRCSSREGPTTVLRASGIKAAPGQEFLPSKCSVYRCSCEALASPQHRAIHLPPLFPGAWKRLSQENLHFLAGILQSSQSLQHEKKKKGTNEVLSALMALMAEKKDNYVPYFLSLWSQPQEMSQVNLKMTCWQWV